MPLPANSRLKPFLAERMSQVNKTKAKRSLGQTQGQIGECPMTRGFHGALAAKFRATGRPGVIAELKGGSPFEEKAYRRSVPYKELAEDFEAVGATALSVAVERTIWQGSYSDLSTVAKSVGLPILAQDIIIDQYQMLEARLSGADAIMLSASIIGKHIAEFRQRAGAVALDPMVQVHTKEELQLALDGGADLICVTNRDIHTFDLVPGRCAELIPLIPADKVLVVAEGGFGTAEDLDAMAKAGAKAVMMGAALMKDGDPAGVLEKVLGVESEAEAD